MWDHRADTLAKIEGESDREWAEREGRWIIDGATVQEQPKLRRDTEVHSNDEGKRSSWVDVGKKCVIGKNVGIPRDSKFKLGWSWE